MKVGSYRLIPQNFRFLNALGDFPGTLLEPSRRRMVNRTAPAPSRAGGMPYSGRVRQPTGKFDCKENTVVTNIVCVENIFIKLYVNNN